ncbi:hypothetical protein GZL_01865 [Streptomyces sp. 769]|nr:hypothetical protein GZL_01865 [Streptomyces sp. 769]
MAISDAMPMLMASSLRSTTSVHLESPAADPGAGELP